MKLAAFFVFIILSANSFAQEELNTAVKVKEEQMSVHDKIAPLAIPNGPSNGLENAQTDAIISLSYKLDLLEERVRKIEKRLP